MKLFAVSFVASTALLLRPALGQQCDSNGLCDKHERCPVWKAEGECSREPDYMKKHCPVSCNVGRRKAAHVKPSDTDECKDQSHRCSVWADLGECEANEVNMKKYCPKSCNVCNADVQDTAEVAEEVELVEEVDDPNCKDLHPNCGFWAGLDECTKNEKYMNANCAKSCDTCQKAQHLGNSPTIVARELSTDENQLLEQTKQYGVLQQAEGIHMGDTLKRARESLAYMKSDQVTELPKAISGNCKNRHELCSFWASIGECENNLAYMATNCAVACMSCHMIDFETRCPKLNNPKAALLPGDLNKMFERIVATAPGNRTLTDAERKELAETNMTEYTVVVHSRPSESSATEVSAVLDKSLPPWVITLDNFLTPEECDAMIQLGYKYGYKRSEDVGAQKFDGTHDSVQSSRRTSENAWCSEFHGCRSEELPKRLHERMSKVMDIPPENSEDFQLLKYEKGQFYRTHHDYIPHQKDRQCGPRILTFFLYLTDVEEGGGTNFPQLNLTVMPKKGRGLLWPSVLNSDPFSKDGRTYHQALDVIDGVKFACNGWIHQYDYVTAQKKGCT